MKKRKTPIQGKGRQFRADLWLDEKITGRTMNALQMRGIKFPDGWNPRKTPEFKQEYQRQLTQFRQQQAAKKAAKQEAQRAARQALGIREERKFLQKKGVSDYETNWQSIGNPFGACNAAQCNSICSHNYLDVVRLRRRYDYAQRRSHFRADQHFPHNHKN